jgi:hypothetical protein
MKLLGIEVENDGVKPNQYDAHLKDESLMVLELFEKGVLSEIYFDQHHCAILVLECASLLEAELELGKLPLVTNGLIHFEIKELNPYTGFSRLLE